MKQKVSKVRVAPVKPLSKTQKEIIMEHIPYAKNIARQYVGCINRRGITLLHLETESCSALCEAALRFDPEKGTDFKTYAFVWCKKFIVAYLRNWGYYEHEDVELVAEDVSDDEEDIQQEREQKAEAMMAVLSDKELNVVRLLYGFDGAPKTFSEVAEIMHLRTARVHEIYDKARTKMEGTF